MGVPYTRIGAAPVGQKESVNVVWTKDVDSQPEHERRVQSARDGNGRLGKPAGVQFLPNEVLEVVVDKCIVEHEAPGFTGSSPHQEHAERWQGLPRDEWAVDIAVVPRAMSRSCPEAEQARSAELRQ